MSKVIILGSGAACGVPTITDGWGECNADNPKNRRGRAGVYFEHQGTRILIDSSADLREQLIANHITALDGVLYTHAHADHTMGIDDLRALNYHFQEMSGMKHAGKGRTLTIYAVQSHMAEIRKRFAYTLVDEQSNELTHRPQLFPQVIEYEKEFNIGQIKIKPLAFAGHAVETTGYCFNDGEIVLIPDYKIIPPQTLAYLQKIHVNVLIMPLTEIDECLYHAGIDIDLAYISQIKPKTTVLTHLGPYCDYDKILQLCPPNVKPAYDNMEIEL